MEYRLKINDEISAVEVETGEAEKLTARIGESRYDVSFTAIHDHHLHLFVNGRSINVYLADQGNGKLVQIGGSAYFVEDADRTEQSRSRKKGPGQSPTEVTPPMPAVVIAVPVAAGDVVKKGQSVVIVSAMKMETTLTAPFDGLVTKVNVAEGDKVMPGDILVDIEKNTPAEEAA